MTAPGRLLAVLVGVVLLAPTTGGGVAAAAAQQPDQPVIGGELLARPRVVMVAKPGVPRPPRVSAAAYVIADAKTGEILAAKAAHRRLRPASTMKILTGLVLLPRLDPDTRYRATFDDANIEGSRVGIVPDGTYTVRNLFEGLFLSSGNDAAHALANVAGGKRLTVRLMTEQARVLNARDTTVRNPSGLDAAGQLTSAYDLALMTRAGLRRSDFSRYVSTLNSTFPGKPAKKNKKRKSFEIWNHNRLLYSYRGAIGVKNGYTTLARNTFVGAAKRHGRTLVVTLMRGSYGAWEEAAALLSWGFRNGPRVLPVGHLVEPGPLPGETGSDEPHIRGPGATAAGAAAAAGSVGAPAAERERPSLSTSPPALAWGGLVVLAALAVLGGRTVRRRRRAPLPPLRSGG